MAGIQDLIAQIPISDLAAKLGVDESTAAEAVTKAIPALLGGMQANAASGGAASLEKAVAKHSGDLVDGGVNLAQVDTTDGKKIVSHVFGSSKDKVASELGKSSGAAGGGIGDVISKALPILAPIVMSYLAKKSATPKASTQQASTQSSGGITDLLGGLLGGGGASGGGLGDLLGGLGSLFGGGSK